MRLAIAASIAVLTLAGSAFADSRVSATLDSGQSAPAQFIAAHAVWDCAGSTCTTSSAPDESTGVTGCQELAHKIGRIASYASEMKSLDARGLAKCNKEAAAPATIGTASR